MKEEELIELFFDLLKELNEKGVIKNLSFIPESLPAINKYTNEIESHLPGIEVDVSFTMMRSDFDNVVFFDLNRVEEEGV